MEKIKNWLIKPYPFPSSNKSKILISLAFGKFVFIFLIIFKPFNLDVLGDKVLYYTFIYGIITFTTMLLHLLILPKFFTLIFNPNKWTIYKMIVFVVIIMLAIGIVNWYFSVFYSKLLNNNNYPLLFFIYKVFLVGIFPILFYVFLTELITSKNNIKVASIISESKSNLNLDDNENEIKLTGSNKKDSLNLKQEALLYISSEKNYASIFHTLNGKIKETLLRVSLNNLETQLEGYNNIVRCHKSYIVNTTKVEKIKGNARSLLLIIPNIEVPIPVSRNFPKELLFTLIK